MVNKWIELVLKYKTTFNLSMNEAMKRAKTYYIKRTQLKKLERELGVKIDYL